MSKRRATPDFDTTTIFKALADPVRLQLLNSVAGHPGAEACVCHISAGVEVSQPTVSHHLKVLRDAGLLTSEAVEDLS